MGWKDETCDRCHKKSDTMIMSMLNMDIVCKDCKTKETKHPRYEEAREAEHREVVAGNYNYPGLLAGEKITYDE